ncbi:hypothetical protein FEA29_00115, partial [Mannheimia haemolytica]
MPETTTANEGEATPTTTARRIWSGLATNGAGTRPRQMTGHDLLRSTPARLLAIGVALLLGTLAVGLIASMAAGGRKQSIDTLL